MSQADRAEFRAAVERIVAAARAVPGVRNVITPYSDPTGAPFPPIVASRSRSSDWTAT